MKQQDNFCYSRNPCYSGNDLKLLNHGLNQKEICRNPCYSGKWLKENGNAADEYGNSRNPCYSGKWLKENDTKIFWTNYWKVAILVIVENDLNLKREGVKHSRRIVAILVIVENDLKFVPNNSVLSINGSQSLL